tara:strand:- start:2566 stop:4887 length:2322 start_codon:yes stop_codon:yes gene_type:complete
LYRINIVIFENKNDKINIKVSDYAREEKFGFIYQRGNYYEPILYRYYDSLENNIHEVFTFTPDLLTNGHYEKIIRDISKKVKENTKESMITRYEEIIKSMDDELTTLMIDNYSYVSYLITKGKKVIPIPPEPIPWSKKYHYIYSFLEINKIKKGMDVFIGKATKRDIEGKVTSLPFKERGVWKVSVRTKEGEDYPSISCRNICFIDEENCKQLLPRYKDVIKYLPSFKDNKGDGDNFTIDVESVLLSEEGNITSILMSNDTYLPVIEEKIKTKYPTEKGTDRLQIENSLYSIKNKDDKRTLFINTQKYEDHITKLAIQHILIEIEEKIIPVTGFVRDSTPYKEGERINFYKKTEKLDGRLFSFIEKLDYSDHMYSSFEKKIIQQVGIIRQILPSDDDDGVYSELTEIKIEVKLLDRISFVLEDPIMLLPHKKLKVYKIINEHIDPLFHKLNEKDYHKYELDRYTTLCNERNELCKYPCTKKGGVCKLYIKEKDIYGNLLLEKIKWKFIEKLIIHGTQKREKIIEETVNLNELSKSTKLDEIFYTFSEYKNGILEEVFMKKSKYINQTGENKPSDERNSFMKRLDTIPYYIQRLFGKDASVVFHLNKENNDFVSLEKSLNECEINYDFKSIKKMLIEELEVNNRPDFIKQYKKDYKNTDEIIQEIKGSNYHLQHPDFKLIMKCLGERGYRFGIILLSQQGNKQKKTDYYFYSTHLDIMDIETAPIILFHHTFYNEEYILSSILVNYGNELRYDTTIRDLYDKNPIHKKWIKIGL